MKWHYFILISLILTFTQNDYIEWIFFTSEIAEEIFFAIGLWLYYKEEENSSLLFVYLYAFLKFIAVSQMANLYINGDEGASLLMIIINTIFLAVTPTVGYLSWKRNRKII